jgi:hypothetical protein
LVSHVKRITEVKVIENRVLKLIFGPKREEETMTGVNYAAGSFTA